MSEVFFVGDLHFGHKNIHKYRSQFLSEVENCEYIIDRWNRRIPKKNSLTYVLGDAAFDAYGLSQIARLNGRKILVRGNHDYLPASEYLKYFEDVHGFLKYKDYWLSHAPIHPKELRHRINIHGHCHADETMGDGYINVCIDWLDDFTPISLTEIKCT